MNEYRSVVSHVSEFSNTKDLNLQGQFKDNYSSLGTQVNKALGACAPANIAQVRSINTALNNLIRVPEGLTKNLLILNLSRNRLKSLTGIEICSRLTFLNASHNMIQTVSTISVLQKLKELFLGNNWLPSAALKEFSGLKSLQLLDLGYNKLSADVDKWN